MHQLIIGNKVYSSWSLRPWLLMKTLNIPFEEIQLALYTQQGKAKIRQYHEAGKVPLLIDSSIDQVIWDSMAIFEYLHECYPDKKLWPEEKQARATARCIANEMHASFNEIRQQLPMNCRADKVFSRINQALQDDIDRVCSIWRECRSTYATDGDFLLGQFSIADAMFAPVVCRFNSYHIPVGKIENTYMQTILNLSAMQQWISAGRADPTVVTDYEI